MNQSNNQPKCRVLFGDNSRTFNRSEIRAQFPQQLIDDVSKLEQKRRGVGIRLGDLVNDFPFEPANITLTSADGFQAELPFEIAKDGVLIFELEDKPLPDTLGGPFRFFTIASAECGTAIADHCKNVKSIVELRLS